MLTLITAFILVNLTTGQPIHQFKSLDECLIASYRLAFVTGQETRCEPRYQAVR